jgi:hypothetical protein
MTIRSAWVVYWVAADGNHNHDVVAVFDPRKSERNIEEFVLEYYISQIASVKEKLNYCSRKADFPYQVQYDDVDGVRCANRMTCGHNPFIVAERVRNLTLVNDDGVERLTWDSLPKPTAEENSALRDVRKNVP